MIPRSDICAVPIDTSMENLTKIVGSHTRTLVYRDTLDDIVGFVHIKDLYFNLSESKKLNLRSILRKPIMVVHSMKLIDLLKYMQQQRTHIACVVDEYGGTDGIVTIEDVISELIGPMNDEHETQNANQINYEIINKDTIIVNARMEIEDLEKLLNIPLKSANDDFDTIGGMVLAKAGKMPNIKDIIEINDKLKAEIILKDLRTIKTIKLMISE
jgi:CBS domain containing-hemolysin-like protein